MNSLDLRTLGSAETFKSLDSEKTGPSAKVHAELQRILASPQFNASDRNRRFLAYVVEETLAGRGERIKAYNIATVVFGRDESFDPQLDPVVRMEARRLRRSLERFYLVEGDGNAIHIAMPKGSYVPAFQETFAQERARSNVIGLEREHASLLPAISISIFPIEVEDDRQIYKNHGDALSRQIAVAFGRFPEIGVFLPRANPERHANDDAGRLIGKRALCFTLGGNATLIENALKVTATLVSDGSGKVVWGETFEHCFGEEGILKARERVANRIVRAVAGSFDGILIDNPERSDSRHLPGSLESLLRFRQYRRHVRPDLFLAARECLERFVRLNPRNPETNACLSQIYSDGLRFDFAADKPSELQSKAIELAKESLELAPNSSKGYHARGLALWLSGDAHGSIEALRRACVLNPNSIDAVADLGLYLCLRGEWVEGISLINDANEENTNSGLQRLGLSLHQFSNGQFEQALDEARSIRSEDVPSVMVAQAIALVRLGRKEEAAAALARTGRHRLHCACNMLGGFDGGVIQTALAAEIRSALQEAEIATVNVATA